MIWCDACLFEYWLLSFKMPDDPVVRLSIGQFSQLQLSQGKVLPWEISLASVPMQENVAEKLFTKALPRDKLEAFRKALGLLPFVD